MALSELDASAAVLLRERADLLKAARDQAAPRGNVDVTVHNRLVGLEAQLQHAAAQRRINLCAPSLLPATLRQCWT